MSIEIIIWTIVVAAMSGVAGMALGSQDVKIVRHTVNIEDAQPKWEAWARTSGMWSDFRYYFQVKAKVHGSIEHDGPHYRRTIEIYKGSWSSYENRFKALPLFPELEIPVDEVDSLILAMKETQLAAMSQHIITAEGIVKPVIPPQDSSLPVTID